MNDDVQASTSGMPSSDLRQSYQAIISAVAAGDVNSLDGLISVDIVDHNPVPGQASGLAGIKYWVGFMRSAFPDLTGEIEDTVVESDNVAGRVMWRGTHRGEFLGLQGEGRTVQFAAYHMLRFEHGLAVEWWGTADVFGALSQLGQYPRT